MQEGRDQIDRALLHSCALTSLPESRCLSTHRSDLSSTAAPKMGTRGDPEAGLDHGDWRDPLVSKMRVSRGHSGGRRNTPALVSAQWGIYLNQVGFDGAMSRAPESAATMPSGCVCGRRWAMDTRTQPPPVPSPQRRAGREGGEPELRRYPIPRIGRPRAAARRGMSEHESGSGRVDDRSHGEPRWAAAKPEQRTVAEALVTMNLGEEGKAIAQPALPRSRPAMAAKRSGATDQ